MSLKQIMEVVWSRYGLAGAVVVLVCLVAIDQLYHIGLGEMVAGWLGK